MLAIFFLREKDGFLSHSGHKTAAAIEDTGKPEMVCSCRSSCLDLPVALVDFQMKGCESRLRHVCQGGMWLCMKSILTERS